MSTTNEHTIAEIRMDIYLVTMEIDKNRLRIQELYNEIEEIKAHNRLLDVKQSIQIQRAKEQEEKE